MRECHEVHSALARGTGESMVAVEKGGGLGRGRERATLKCSQEARIK